MRIQIRPIFAHLMLAVMIASIPVASADSLKQLQFLEDPGRALSIQDVASSQLESRWRPIKGPQPDFGLSRSRFWIRAEVEIPTAATGRWYLSTTNPFLDRFAVYQIGPGGTWRSSQTGLFVPMSQRDTDFGDPVLPLELSEARSRVYLSVEGFMALVLPLRLEPASAFADLHSADMFTVGLFLGYLAFCSILSIGICLFVRDRLVLHYSSFIITISLFYFLISGIAIRYVAPEWPELVRRSIHFMGALSFLMHVQFIRAFIDSRRKVPRLDRLLVLVAIASSIRGVWMVFQITPGLAGFGAIVVLVGCLLTTAMAVMTARKSRNARYLLASSLIFNTSVFCYLLQYTGVHFFTRNVELIACTGTAFEVAILSAGLLDWIHRVMEDARRRTIAAVREEKLRSLGQMAAGVVHEINNPLTVIQCHAELLNRSLSSGDNLNRERVVGATSEIMKHVQRISNITRAVKTFARRSDSEPLSSTALAEIVADSLNLCRARFKSADVALPQPPIPPDARVLARAGECAQVLVNLLNNAVDAVCDSTRRQVSIEITDLGSTFEISVSDSGPGVPDEIRNFIFDPFFTTKSVGAGTGLGLSISRTIVESHGGALRVESSSEGTRFTFGLLKA